MVLASQTRTGEVVFPCSRTDLFSVSSFDCFPDLPSQTPQDRGCHLIILSWVASMAPADRASYRASLPMFLLLVGLQCGLSFIPPMPHHYTLSQRSMTTTWTRLFGVRAVNSFDASFELDPQVQETLTGFLEHPDMLQLVTQEAKCTAAAFTGHLFQPVPYSPGTRYGMPPHFEQYHNNPDYAICNVPPLIMFKSRVFKPSRLCAIYSIEGLEPEERERVLKKREAMVSLDDEDEDPVWESDDHLRDTGASNVPLDGASTFSAVGEAMRNVVHGAGQDEDDDDVDLDSLVV